MIRLLLIAMASAMLSGAVMVAYSQDAPAPADPPADPAAESEDTPAPPVSDDIFIPSEEVQADEELAFPVNI